VGGSSKADCIGVSNPCTLEIYEIDPTKTGDNNLVAVDTGFTVQAIVKITDSLIMVAGEAPTGTPNTLKFYDLLINPTGPTVTLTENTTFTNTINLKI